MRALVIFFFVMVLLNVGTHLAFIATNDYPRKRHVATFGDDMFQFVLYTLMSIWAGIILFGGD